MRPRNCIATKAFYSLAWLLALGLAGAACAAPVGTITDLSGPLLDRKADGTVKILATKSSVDSGDTLVSEKDTYARVKFVDNSEITLRPNTQFKIENFSFDEAKPESDNAFFSLVRGGLRSITGLLGKRNKERFGLNTPTATIGIRGTNFIVEYIPPSQAEAAAQAAAERAAYRDAALASLDVTGSIPYGGQGSDAPRAVMPRGTLGMPQPLQLAQAMPLPGSDRAPGLYVQVLDGMINVSNGGGAQNFTAGQFGFTPGFKQPPVILPNNPGMQFTPPPSFSNTTTNTSGSQNNKAGSVDCQVR
ncbi:MAG: FecR domain-containing protein [Burkholderiaceae bacterium]|nr:FecR domain-containing protein [Burkholderiaceae bacterium]